MKTLKHVKKPADFLASLISTAYLPYEVPPVITTKYFAAFCKIEYAAIKIQQPTLIGRTTNYETFTAPRTNSGRRNLALVHPLAQTAISLLITQHRKKIQDLITRSGLSLYRCSPDKRGVKAFAGLDFRTRDTLGARIYSENPFVLQADISRFFYTAYTHSIPWAVLGKERVKEWLWDRKKRKKLDAHWSSHFDKALQSCQSRETFGIPVGPDTSRIIAEILISGVESEKELSLLLKDKLAFRLVDDFAIGFESEDDARKCLAALRAALWKFNLQLNEEKTSVVLSKSLFAKKWRYDLQSVRLSDRTPTVQEGDIYRLIDLALHHCAVTKTDAPAILACSRITRLGNIENNFSIIVDALLRLGREFPRCVSHIVIYLINNQTLARGNIRNRIVKWVRWMLAAHLPHGHDFEVAWCLVLCAVLKISIREVDVPHRDTMPNAVVFALLGLLREKHLLEVPLSRWPWRSYYNKTGIYSENWLPFYEAVRRKWTNDSRMKSAVNSDPMLSKMLAAKVTFLEDQIFDAQKIFLSRRVFSKSKNSANVLPAQAGSNATGPKRRRARRILAFANVDEDFDY